MKIISLVALIMDNFVDSLFPSVRGFVHDGWRGLNNAGGDMSGFGKLFQISTAQFLEGVVPELTGKDTVIYAFLHSKKDSMSGEWRSLLAQTSKKCKTAVISIASSPHRLDLTDSDLQVNYTASVILPYLFLLPDVPSFAELCAKFVFNAISTAACITKGRVYGNTMINLGVRYVRSLWLILTLVQQQQTLFQSTRYYCKTDRLFHRSS